MSTFQQYNTNQYSVLESGAYSIFLINTFRIFYGLVITTKIGWTQYDGSKLARIKEEPNTSHLFTNIIQHDQELLEQRKIINKLIVSNPKYTCHKPTFIHSLLYQNDQKCVDSHDQSAIYITKFESHSVCTKTKLVSCQLINQELQ